MPSPFQFSNLPQSLNNQLCQDSSVSFFEKVNKGHLKMVDVNYLKWPDLALLFFNKIIKEPGNSFQSPALSQKHGRNVFMQHTRIWPNFIFIVLRIQKK